jgi:hypothetical protein
VNADHTGHGGDSSRVRFEQEKNNMDGLEFTSNVIGHLAWPVAILFLGFMFREQVRALLAKMKTLKAPGGIEADFSMDVAKVAEEAKQVHVEVVAPPPAGTQFGTPSVKQGPPPQDEKDRLYELIRERPAALIVDAWRDLEKAMLDLIGVKGLYVPPSRLQNPALWPTWLVKDNLISDEIAGLIVELRHLRNRVAHAHDWEPTVTDAINYHTSAKLVSDVLRKKLEEIIKQLPNHDND